MADTRTRPGTDRRPLISYLRAQRTTDREVLAILRQSSVRMDAELKRFVGRSGIGAQVRRDQVAMSQAAIQREMATLWRRVGDAVEAGRAEAAAAAVESMYPRNALRSVLPAADVDFLLRSAQETARRGAQTVEARVNLSQIPLAESVYHNEHLSSGKVDEIVNSALARGASAAELARDVRGYIRPDVRGGVKYAAMRLGRTELNNAFHAQQVRSGIDTPWTTALLWNLSGSHPKPDECNEYADDVHFRGGQPGQYLPHECPAKPHPNCLCFTTPETVEPDAFIDQFMSGQYDAHIDEIMGEGSLAVGGIESLLPATSVLRQGSPGLRTALQTAERQRVELEKAKYITKGRGKGNYNSENGWTSETARARQNYTESLNTDMNLLKRDPAAFAKKWDGDDAWVSYVAEQNVLVERLLAKNQVSEDITVGRAMTGDFRHLKPGEHMADPGFLSTTTDLDVFRAQPSVAFADAVESGAESWSFIIQVPKGTNALPGADYQREIFFGPGTKQRILEVDPETKTVYTQMER